jgi:hypothetical protein
MKLVSSFLMFAAVVTAQGDSQVRPPVTKADVRIVQRAKEILDSPAKWNRADNRICPAEAKTVSLYCALEKATDEVSGNFEHRGAAMQEARFVIEDVAPNWKEYGHRLMGYNNDPRTTFADIQKVFALLEARIVQRLADTANNKAAEPPVTTSDLRIASRARELLDSPAKWNREGARECEAHATTFSLYCALQKAAMDVNGSFDANDGATAEARRVIGATAPNKSKYKALLLDYNNDPATTFADIQNLLKTVEERLAKRSN